jgi:para-nitrobenzyl esterase
VGRQQGGVLEFLGLPYAAPPVGKNRWRPPQDAPPFTGDYNASYFRPSCLQTRDFSPQMGPLDEDCLYLNIYAPVQAVEAAQRRIEERPSRAGPAREEGADVSAAPAPAAAAAAATPLPVLVWFHGGGYTNGGGNESRLNGSFNAGRHVAGAGNGRIIVTLNYRLNVLGFLGGDQLRNRGAGGPANASSAATGNWGFQDQRAALTWLARHVAAFGGDPKQMMIFGESAGAGSVSCHLSSPASMPLLARAAAESGAFADWVAVREPTAASNLHTVAQRVSCLGPHGPDIDCLEQVSGMALVNASADLTFAPTVDGAELPLHPADALDQGLVALIPLLQGSNRDEGASFIGPTPESPNATTEAGFRQYMAQRYNFQGLVLEQLTALYNGSSSAYVDTKCCTAWWWAASHAVGDQKMTCATARAGNNYTALGVQNTYVYYFAFAPDAAQNNPFAYHSSEIPFVWHVDPLVTGQGGAAVADYMSAAWLRFAATGNPNTGASSKEKPWPAFTMPNEEVLQIQAQPKILSGLHMAQCDFWEHHRFFP